MLNSSNYSEHLIKQTDLFHYWEPFHGALIKEENKIGLKLCLSHLAKKKAGKKIHLQNFSPMIWEHSVLIGFDTINQFQSLNKIITGMTHKTSVISTHPEYRTDEIAHEVLESLGANYNRKILRSFFKFSGKDKMVWANRFYKIHGLLGLYEWMRLSMLASKPNLKYFIGANDHSGISQIGFVAARDVGLKTIYIQHASISDKFPPLRTDYALLDGQDALDKYEAAGSFKTKVHLLGASKYDTYLSNRAINTIGDLVGICIGHVLPNHVDFETLCQLLEEKGDLFCLRFHPAVSNEVRQQYSAKGWAISNPEEETALDFIMRCHTVVSADSNILLEAILLKRRPIYLSHDASIFDYYGFLNRKVLEGVCYNAKDVCDMLSKLYHLEDYRPQAKHYQETLYTEWEGRSAELVIQKIKEITQLT